MHSAKCTNLRRIKAESIFFVTEAMKRNITKNGGESNENIGI